MMDFSTYRERLLFFPLSAFFGKVRHQLLSRTAVSDQLNMAQTGIAFQNRLETPSL
jgi:hypothetical protein